MRFLLIGQGFPDVLGTGSGSGIGTYLRALTGGLTRAGHVCHVICWQEAESTLRRAESVGLRGEGGGREPWQVERGPWDTGGLRAKVCARWSVLGGLCSRVCALWSDACEVQQDGIRFFLLPHAYWPMLERFWPDSRDVWNLRRLVRQLDRQFHYDRIEVESEEGIAIGVLKDFEQKSILRIYTTLAQMVEHKDVPMTRIVKYRLDREKQSFATARCVLVPSGLHRDEMIAGGVMPERVRVNPIGIADPGVRRVMAAWPPLFVLVGSPDLRKGFDRIRPVMEVLAACSQSYRFALVSEAGENAKIRFGLLPPLPGSVEMTWYSRISDKDLFCLYSQASAVLHLARYESFGLPLIEAAAVGVPVVATRVGIAPELMEGALERFVVNGDEPVAVAAALMTAVRERDQIGEMLRKGYEERFTVQRMVDGWLCEVLATDNGTSDRRS